MSAERVWKKPGQSEEKASIKFVRPSELAKEGFEGVIVEGTFIESFPNHFDNAKLDFKFEQEDGSILVINGAGNLGYRMKEVIPGDFCQVTYLGKKEITTGKMQGRSAHNFEVRIA